MAAKTAGTWAVYEPVGIADLTVVGTTALHDLGKRCKAKDLGTTAYGFGEFIYLKGVTSTVRGSVVLVKDDFTTSLLAARDKGAVAVALAVCDANTKYGWYQIVGQGVAVAGTVSANLPLYITAGGVTSSATTGEQIVGMRAVSAADTNTAVVNMATYPAVCDFDNA